MQPDANRRASRGLALVTGGARRLGKAIALDLGERGYDIALHYHRSRAEAEQTAAEIRQMGAVVTLLPADLRVPDAIHGLFARIDLLPGPLVAVVNSAAEMPRGSLLEISPAAWDATLALDLRAPLIVAQEAARRMKAGGAIVNLSDVGARRAWSGYTAYSVSKAGLEALTRLMARALAPSIRVNAVAPGLVLPSAEVAGEAWERLVAKVPLRRAALPAEIAQTVAFLIQNEYITGQTIVVDGGYQFV